MVSGQAFPADFPENQPLRATVQEILAKTKNTGQPIENWIVTLDGKELDFSKSLKELGLKDGLRLLLNPRTGRGGC